MSGDRAALVVGQCGLFCCGLRQHDAVLAHPNGENGLQEGGRYGLRQCFGERFRESRTRWNTQTHRSALGPSSQEALDDRLSECHREQTRINPRRTEHHARFARSQLDPSV
jgi:hypothetical protein